MKQGWEVKKLNEVCNYFGDGNWIESKDQSIEGYRLIQTGNIGVGDFRNKKGKERFISEKTFNQLKCTEIFAGDILISRLPDPIGRSCILPRLDQKMITAVDCSIVRLNKDVLIEGYFKYFSQSKSYYQAISEKITGTTRSRISRKNLGLINVPIPPLEEQKQIVAILDKAFEKIEKSKEIAEKNLKNAKELFESYLQEVFENKGDNWEEKSVYDVARIINGFAFASKDFKYTNNIKSIKITNVGVGEFIEENENLLPKSFKESHSDVAIKAGNIVIALTRTIISSGLKVAIVPQSYQGSLLNQRVAALDPKQEIVNCGFLYNYFQTKKVKEYVLSKANTLMQPNLSIKDLKELLILIPPLKTQTQIVTKLNQLQEKTKKLETIYQQKLTQLEELKKSILQ